MTTQVIKALESVGFWESHSPGFPDEDWESHEGYEIAFDYWSGYWVFVCDSDGQNWVYNVGEFFPEQSPHDVIDWVRQLISSAPTTSPKEGVSQ